MIPSHTKPGSRPFCNLAQPINLFHDTKHQKQEDDDNKDDITAAASLIVKTLDKLDKLEKKSHDGKSTFVISRVSKSRSSDLSSSSSSSSSTDKGRKVTSGSASTSHTSATSATSSTSGKSKQPSIGATSNSSINSHTPRSANSPAASSHSSALSASSKSLRRLKPLKPCSSTTIKSAPSMETSSNKKEEEAIVSASSSSSPSLVPSVSSSLSSSSSMQASSTASTPSVLSRSKSEREDKTWIVPSSYSLLTPRHTPTVSPMKSLPDKTTVSVIVVLKPPLAGAPMDVTSKSNEILSEGLAPRFVYHSTVRGFSSIVPAGELNRLNDHPDVLRIEPDHRLSLPTRIRLESSSLVADVAAAASSSLSSSSMVSAEASRSSKPPKSDRSTGLYPSSWRPESKESVIQLPVHVYILDTGIASNHPDIHILPENRIDLVPHKHDSDSSGSNGSTSRGSVTGERINADADDDQGHSTHVAGIIAGINIGRRRSRRRDVDGEAMYKPKKEDDQMMAPRTFVISNAGGAGNGGGVSGATTGSAAISAFGATSSDKATKRRPIKRVLGICPGVQLHSIKVLDENGDGAMSTILAGIEYLIKEKQRHPDRIMLANMSFGFECGTTKYNVLDEAVVRAIHAGIPVIISAGNDFVNVAHHSPAHVAEAITVGAYDADCIHVSSGNPSHPSHTRHPLHEHPPPHERQHPQPHHPYPHEQQQPPQQPQHSYPQYQPQQHLQPQQPQHILPSQRERLVEYVGGGAIRTASAHSTHPTDKGVRGSSEAEKGTLISRAIKVLMAKTMSADTSAEIKMQSSRSRLARFSNYGSGVSIFAPGVNIKSTWKNQSYKTKSGTSMAAPHVTAVAALYMFAHPRATPAMVKEYLLTHARRGMLRGLDSGSPNLVLSLPAELVERCRSLLKDMAMIQSTALPPVPTFTPPPPLLGPPIGDLRGTLRFS